MTQVAPQSWFSIKRRRGFSWVTILRLAACSRPRASLRTPFTSRSLPDARRLLPCRGKRPVAVEGMKERPFDQSTQLRPPLETAERAGQRLGGLRGLRSLPQCENVQGGAIPCVADARGCRVAGGPECIPRHRSNYRSRGGAECDADAQFTRASRDAIRHHRVDANGRETQPE